MGEDIPAGVRAARMGWYQTFVNQIDSHGEKVSSRFSEVDLSDPEDMLVVMLEGSRTMTVHFGDEHYFDRYQLYQTHVGEWEQQYPKLEKVDLRNAPQVILGMRDAVSPPTATNKAATASAAAVPANAPADDTAPITAAPAPVKAPAAVAPPGSKAHAIAAHPAKPKPVVKAKPSQASTKKTAALKKKPAHPATVSAKTVAKPQGGR